MLAAARPQRAKGREVSVREILDIAARRLDEDSAMLPEVETNLQQTIGFSYSSLAIYDRAMTHLQQAHRLAVQTQGADSEEAARALSGMAQVHMLQGNLDEALTISLQLRDFHLARHGALSPEYSTAVANLANVYADIGDYQQAESLLRETLALDRQSQNGNNRGDLAISLNNLASVLSDQEKFAQAIVLLEESIELRRAVFGETSAEVVIAMMNLGFAQAGEEAWSDAEATLREAVAIADVVYGRMHTRTGVGLSNLSKPVAELGRVDEAIGLAEEALVVLEQTIGPDSLGVGQVKVHLGKLYTMDGQVSRGEQEMNTGWQQIAAAIGAETARTRDVAARIAMYYQDKGEPDAAAQWTARAGGSGD